MTKRHLMAVAISLATAAGGMAEAQVQEESPAATPAPAPAAAEAEPAAGEVRGLAADLSATQAGTSTSDRRPHQGRSRGAGAALKGR